MDESRRVNLSFHGVGTPGAEREDGEADYWISEEFFLRVLDLVRDEPDVHLSFDDGNRSDVDVALPALLERRLSASFFPVAQRLTESHSLDREALRHLVTSGMTVGTHGLRHRGWRGMTKVELDDELVLARREISDASGAPVRYAACPLGSYDRRVLRRLRELDYAAVFTSDRAVAHPNAWLQPRYSLRRQDTLDDVRGLLRRRPKTELLDRYRMSVKRWR